MGKAFPKAYRTSHSNLEGIKSKRSWKNFAIQSWQCQCLVALTTLSKVPSHNNIPITLEMLHPYLEVPQRGKKSEQPN